MALHGVTILLAALLLFLVQLIEARFLLPWFGGGAWLWTGCMLFFQVGLLLGYAWAHLIARLPRRKQVTLHALLVAGALLQVLWIGLAPSPAWAPDPERAPLPRLVAVLLVHTGLPFIALASTAPLIQRWASAGRAGAPPWWLYAVSNVGALVALLAYPFLLEPTFGRAELAGAWGVAFAVWALLVGGCAYLRARMNAEDVVVRGAHATPRTWLLWLLLPALGSAWMLSITNQVTASVAPVPFLWVLPLAVYLLTFVVAFQGEHLAPRALFVPLLALSVLLLAPALYDAKSYTFTGLLPRFALALFAGGMVCHGELFRLRPREGGDTAYYLAIAAGGALGGLAVSLGAPYLLSTQVELQLTIVATGVVVACVLWGDRTLARERRVQGAGALVALSALFVAWFAVREAQQGEGVIRRVRGPYGTLAVYELGREDPEFTYRTLVNGTHSHGLQYTHPANRYQPTSYYTLNSGAGLVAQFYRFRAPETPRHIGVVGMGIGVLAIYAAPNDAIRLYEIDPHVAALARSEFDYLARAESLGTDVTVVLGDARVNLEREERHGYDVLYLDAFVGDTVPVHLITKEALELYLAHLADDGALCLHVSSAHLDFRPLVARLAHELGLTGLWIEREQGVDGRGYPSQWAVLTRNVQLARALLPMGEPLLRADGPLWTDEHASVFSLFD